MTRWSFLCCAFRIVLWVVSSSKKPFPSMTSIWCPWLGLLNSVVSRKTSGPQAREKTEILKKKLRREIYNTTDCWRFRNPANSPVEVGSLSTIIYVGFLLHPRWVFSPDFWYLLSLLKWICWVADIWMATGGSHKVVVVESYAWTNTCEACAMKLLKFFFIIDDMACGKCVGIAIGFSTLRSFIR